MHLVANEAALARNLQRFRVMIGYEFQTGAVNILASDGGWAWPIAVRNVFEPCGVNLLVAGKTSEFVNVLGQQRIHTAIVDMESQACDGLATIRAIRKGYPLLPCILLSSGQAGNMLGRALELDVFSVIRKPVEMDILKGQLDRLFVKKYGSRIFSCK